MYFLVFHGEERFGKAHAHDTMRMTHAHDTHAKQATKATIDPLRGHDSEPQNEEDHGHHGLAPGQKPHESPWVVTLPLILLAIPSVIIGFLAIGRCCTATSSRA
jgi:NADH-quinone oxidoreductase subunit L